MKENMLEFVIAKLPVAAEQWAIVAESDFKVTVLLTGLIVLTGGLWLLWYHREQFNQLQAELKQDSPEYTYERRKLQRRSIVGALVASCGIVLAGFYWVQNEVAFAILLGLLLLLIVGISILALLDMVSIGLKHGMEQLAEPDSETDQAIAAAIAKHHHETSNACTDENSNS